MACVEAQTRRRPRSCQWRHCLSQYNLCSEGAVGVRHWPRDDGTATRHASRVLNRVTVALSTGVQRKFIFLVHAELVRLGHSLIDVRHSAEQSWCHQHQRQRRSVQCCVHQHNCVLLDEDVTAEQQHAAYDDSSLKKSQAAKSYTLNELPVRRYLTAGSNRHIPGE